MTRFFEAEANSQAFQGGLFGWTDSPIGEGDIDRDSKQDQAVVFYKKYRHDARPKFSVALQVKSENRDLASEDRIELVTLLREPASCYLNDKSLGVVREGLQIHSIPSQPGPVRVRVVRDGQQVIKFQAPTLISASPFRTDRLTYSYSSVFDREFEKLFK